MSKGRLEEIKKKYNYERLGEFIDAKPVNPYELKWLIQQAEKAEKFRKALEFYADEKSWMNRKVTILMDGEPTDVEDCPAIFDDGGNIAHKALEG